MKLRGSMGNILKTYILINLKNLGEVDKFLDTYGLSKLYQEAINH
jgi:hypothetical protein